MAESLNGTHAYDITAARVCWRRETFDVSTLPCWRDIVINIINNIMIWGKMLNIDWIKVWIYKIIRLLSLHQYENDTKVKFRANKN